MDVMHEREQLSLIETITPQNMACDKARVARQVLVKGLSEMTPRELAAFIKAQNLIPDFVKLLADERCEELAQEPCFVRERGFHRVDHHLEPISLNGSIDSAEKEFARYYEALGQAG